MSEKLTRQQIYDRIKATSRDSFILEEMQRLGFWDSSPSPSLPEILIKKEAELNKELNDLSEKNRNFSNSEAMLKEMRKERMKKAREKREETKRKNEQKRIEKAARWSGLQEKQIIYLGEGVSKGLNSTENNEEELRKFKLPIFNNVTELANSIQIDISSLRFLVYNRKVSKINHYHTFEIPKKSGGKRKISAPKSRLKKLQNWVLESIINLLPTGDMAHGFVKNRSIVSNANPHIGKDIVINVDLKDFFPSISYKRVKGLFHKFGYSEQIAIILALICTQADTQTVEIDGVTYYVQKGERFLPQGSPASPAISNLIAYKLDKRLEGLAKTFKFTYTRYADDLTFSTSKDNQENISKLLFFLKKTIKDEGFEIHPEKTQIMRKGSFQKVTGIVVNEKPNVERKQLRKFRALLHNIEINGWKDQQWGKALHLINAIEGYICFVSMVNKEKGEQFNKQLKRVIGKHGRPEVIRPEVIKVKETPKQVIDKIESSTSVERTPEPENKDWWDIL